MIRINLLEEQRGAKRAPSMELPTAPIGGFPPILVYAAQAALPGIAILIVAFLFINWKTELARLDRDIAEARAEVQRLQKVIKLNEELQAKRELLKRKIEVIEDLKRNQQVPVVMLYQISTNLADLVWFTQMNVSGRRVNLRGKSQGEYPFASFIGNLEVSEFFDGIVPQRIGVEGGNKNVHVWVLSANFVMPSIDNREEDEESDGT